MRIWRLLSIVVLVALSGAAQTVIPVGEFRSVELHDGGTVIVRHGTVQRVTILAGDSRAVRIGVADGQRLVIDNCKPDCPGDHRLQVEVVTPELAAVSVSNGGTVRSAGAFPAQAAIKASVEQGGRIDIRSIAADSVNASVYSGGGIFTNARQTLTAAVASGGAITYWGDARVKRSVRDGGVVARGTPADADKPLSELGPPLYVIPPIPPVPPVPPVRNDGG